MAIRQPAARPSRAPRRMTEQQYLALPEEKPYLEFVDGRIEEKPMPDDNHRRLTGEITGLFWMFEKTAGGDFGPEGRARLRDGLYRLPDTAYWAPGRPAGKDSLPSLAVEVLSPEDSRPALRRKCRAYREYGVDAGWLVDPDRRVVEVFEGDRDGSVLGADDTLTSAVMPGFELPLAELFAVLDRPR